MLLGIRWGSLRTKIIAWSFVPTAIILVAVASVMLYAYQRVTEDLVLERDQELTRLSAGQLMTELTEYAGILADVARMVESKDPAAQQTALQRARNRLVVFDAGVVILNTYGRVAAADPERPEILGQDWSNRSYFREIVRTQGPAFSDVVADGLQGAEVIVVAVPVKGSQGEFLGTLAGLFRLGTTAVSPFYGSIVKLRIGESGTNYLVDRNGRVIYHSNTDRMGDDFSGQAVVQQVLSGKVGAIRTRDRDGQDIVAAFAPVPGTPWGLVTEETWAALIHPSQGYLQFLSLLLALGVVVPALVVTVGVRRITRPIADLIGAAQAVAAGNFGQTISAPSGDELEELAKQFNLMSAQLQESYAHLERKVTGRTRELATLNAIAAVVSRSLDLAEILQNALDKTLEVTSMEAGAAFRLEEIGDPGQARSPTLILMAHRGLPGEFTRQAARLSLEASLASQAAREGQLVVRQVATYPVSDLRQLMEREGLRLVVSVPLMAKGRMLGALNLGTRSLRSLAPEELALLASIAQQIGVAVENARLYDAEQARRRQAATLLQVASVVGSTLELDEVLDRILDQLRRVVDYDSASIQLLQQGKLQVIAGRGYADVKQALGMTIPLSEEFPNQRVVEEGRPVNLADAPVLYPAFRGLPYAQMRSWLGVPLSVQERIIGMITLDRREPGGYGEEEVQLATAFADQAALALENARLYQQAEQLAVVEERGRLARELHDSVTQSLYSLTLFAAAGRRVAAAGDLVRAQEYLAQVGETGRQALKEMRLLVYQLRPVVLEQEGLVGALQHRLDAVEKRAGLETSLVVAGIIELPVIVEEGLYRIAQEALNNALKHAEATAVTVHLRACPEGVEMEVVDNGTGFDPATAVNTGGLGLVSMRERAERMGGSLTLISAPGKGTTVRASLMVGVPPQPRYSPAALNPS
ncbi:MAG TPA: hypothetical protein DEP84_19415 [Chloroflexi bacterium]|nr:hypothetical protein [Chloroflexota bacterium]